MSLLYALYIKDQHKTVYGLLRLLLQHDNHNGCCNIAWYNELHRKHLIQNKCIKHDCQNWVHIKRFKKVLGKDLQLNII